MPRHAAGEEVQPFSFQPFGSAIYRKTKCFDNIVKENPVKNMYIVWWKGWRGFFFTELL